MRRKDGKMRCWLRRNQDGTTDHILRRYLLQNSCRICPLQRLNTLHKLPDQRALRLRIQHGKEKHQGRCGSRVSPSLQITVRTAGDTKLLRHRFLRQRHLLPQGRQFRGKSSAGYGFILKTSIVYKFYGDFMSK